MCSAAYASSAHATGSPASRKVASSRPRRRSRSRVRWRFWTRLAWAYVVLMREATSSGLDHRLRLRLDGDLLRRPQAGAPRAGVAPLLDLGGPDRPARQDFERLAGAADAAGQLRRTHTNP